MWEYSLLCRLNLNEFHIFIFNSQYCSIYVFKTTRIVNQKCQCGFISIFTRKYVMTLDDLLYQSTGRIL